MVVTNQNSIDVISENELLPTITIPKDDLFLKPSVNYFKDKIEVDNLKKKRKSCCFYLCFCCLFNCKKSDKNDKEIFKTLDKIKK